MGILLAFTPFVVFALVDRLTNAVVGLGAGAVVAAALLVRDWLTPGRSAKILEIGTTLLFCGLALYAALGLANWSVIGVRLCVDSGLLLIVVFSMAIGRPFTLRPFTLQYARETVAPVFWRSPDFIRTNYIITAAWAVAFAAMVIVEAALPYVPEMPPRLGVLVIIASLVGAVKFTGWYPERVKARRRA